MFCTWYALAPPGATTSTMTPLVLPSNDRAMGELTEIFPLRASASGSPTICQTFLSPVSSSINVTVAPNLIVSPDSFETSITSSTSKFVLKFKNTGLIDLLVCLGGLVLRILGQVGIVGNRFLNPLNQTWTLDPGALAQLTFKSRMTRGGHGEFSHRLASPINSAPSGILCFW
jgi:hypothetical protein